jgi:hypothetical protein
MSELDELAAVASAHNARQTIRRAEQRKRKRLIFWCTAAGVVVVGFAILSALLRSQGVIPSARRFSVQYRDRDSVAAFIVTNEADSSLVVKSVVVNGEYECRPGALIERDTIPDRTRTYPVELTIGESAGFLKIYGDDGYSKQPVYVDFVTNRGTHRFRMGKGWE